MINFYERGKLISLKDIKEIEEFLGFSIPKTYRDFLIKHNGGIPDHDFLELRLFDLDQSNTNLYIKIEKFLSLDELKQVWENSQEIFKSDSFLPIAEVFGGMLICVNFSEEENGLVYYTDFDFGNIKIGPFNEFISHLIKEEDVDYSKYGVLEEPEPLEEQIIRAGDIDSLKELISKGYDFGKIIKGYDVRLIELATIFKRLSMVQYIHENGSQFYDSLSIAEGNLEFYPGEGLEEIINYIKVVR